MNSNIKSIITFSSGVALGYIIGTLIANEDGATLRAKISKEGDQLAEKLFNRDTLKIKKYEVA